MKNEELKEYYLLEPVKAYRVWVIDYDDRLIEHFRLQSASLKVNGCTYIPGKNKAACGDGQCFHGNMSCAITPKEIPVDKGSCGFYAHKYLVDLFDDISIRSWFMDPVTNNIQNIHVYDNLNYDVLHSIAGVVELSGKVIEHEFGYRAEYLEIKKLLWLGKDRYVYFDNPYNIHPIRGKSYTVKWETGNFDTQDVEINAEPLRFDSDLIKRYLSDYYKVPIEYYVDYFRKEGIK